MAVILLLMAPSTTWLSLTDLGRIYGISAIHCGRALQQEGWRDREGRPTPDALKAGAAYTQHQHPATRSALWNPEVCKGLFEKSGYQPINRAIKIEQWTQLLEALTEGSPSINETAEHMSEELPEELIGDVNSELARRGCHFRVRRVSESTQLPASAF